MNLEPLRMALRAGAEADAGRGRAEVEDACARRLLEAETQAQALMARGRRDGEEAAAHERLRRRAAATRRARELRLEAQRTLVDELRSRACEAALQLKTDPRYPELLDRLSQIATAQLGAGAKLEIDPPEFGGVVARAGARSVDYTLPALVDRAIGELDGKLDTLWR